MIQNKNINLLFSDLGDNKPAKITWQATLLNIVADTFKIFPISVDISVQN